MDINNNQQINTFTKGMNTDVSDMLMDNSQYRYAKNIRLVTNTESNSGEVRLTDGTELSEIPEFIYGDIKAMTSIRDVVIVASSSPNGDYIYICNISDNKGWVKVYESNTEECFGEYLSLVTRYENDNLIKLYIADGKNQLMYINIAPYINYTDSAPEPLVGIDNIAMSVEEFISPISALLSKSSGSIPGVKILYVYRYYKLGGAATSISPVSNVITLYKTENEGYRETDAHTSRAIDLTIPEPIDSVLNYIQIYRISYIQVGQLPTVNIIYDDVIPANNSYTDTGNNVQSVDLSELLGSIKFTFIPKIIESKNNYLFASNIEYILSTIDSLINDDDVRCLSSGDYDGDTLLSYNKQFDQDNIMQFDIQNWKLKDSDTIGGEGRYLSWTYDIRNVLVDKYNRKFEINGTTVGQEIKGQILSLRQGEVYRYGAMFYDEKGNKSSVKWIADIMAPDINTNGERLAPAWHRGDVDGSIPSGAPYGYVVQQIGIDFTVKSMPEGMSAVEIVRVSRSVADRITITEGPAGFPYRIYHKKNSEAEEYDKTVYICPTGFLSTNIFYADSSDADEDDDFIRSNRAVTDNNYLMFASPEYAYLPDDIKNLVNGDKNNLQIDVKYNMRSLCDSITTSQASTTFGQGNPNLKYIKVIAGRNASNDPYDMSHGSMFVFSLTAPEFVQQKIEPQYRSSNAPIWIYNRSCATVNSFISEYPFITNYSDDRYFLIEESVLNSNYRNISAYVALMNDLNIDGRDKNKYSIDSIGYPTVPQFDSFFGTDENKTNWANHITSVGSDVQYSHWSTPLLMSVADPIGHMRNEDTLDSAGTLMGGIPTGIRKRYPVLYPTGSTGKCMVMRLKTPMSVCSTDVNDMSYPIIRLRKIGVTPYGGRFTTQTSSYVSYSNIIKEVGTTKQIFDGDCYPGVFVYNASHAWWEPNTPAGIRQAGIYIIPVESDIDLSATYGDTYNKLNGEYAYYIQDDEAAINNNYQQSKKAYLYNTSYGASPNAITYSATKYTEIDTSACDTRVHHSQPKTNGEHIDNWLNFKALDFLDVDSRFGEITNMRLFKDRMLFWQNNATGVLSINERTVLNDISANEIILGTGAVLQRYDYISTAYGMLPNQYDAEIQSNNTQYYWDGYNKEILAYAGGMELLPLTKSKAVTSYINMHDSISHPSLSYDKKFNELISSVVDDGSIVYNEQTLSFTSVYTFNPTYRTTINDRLYYAYLNYIYRTAISMPLASTLFGEPANPLIQYVVNQNAQYPKVFDIATFGGRFYGGDDLSNLTFTFDTPLKQHSVAIGNNITNREYDFRLCIPRNAYSFYGDRMRGKTMQCELSSDSNSTDFSLQYIITKYRMSWS